VATLIFEWRPTVQRLTAPVTSDLSAARTRSPCRGYTGLATRVHAPVQRNAPTSEAAPIRDQSSFGEEKRRSQWASSSAFVPRGVALRGPMGTRGGAPWEPAPFLRVARPHTSIKRRVARAPAEPVNQSNVGTGGRQTHPIPSTSCKCRPARTVISALTPPPLLLPAKQLKQSVTPIWHEEQVGT